MVLQHGTILRKVDIPKMFSLLRVSSEKIRDKMITSVRDRVCSLEDVLGTEIPFSELSDALISGFTDVFPIKLVLGHPTNYELELARQLARKKVSDDWLFMR